MLAAQWKTALVDRFAAFAVDEWRRGFRPRGGIGPLMIGGWLIFVAGCWYEQESIPHVEGIEVSLDDANFDREVLQSEIPVLVDFGASWCGPCRMMDPLVALLSEEFEGRVKVGKIDVDESPKLAQQYDVEGLPTFVLFRDGQEVERHAGTRTHSEMTRWLDRYAATPAASAP